MTDQQAAREEFERLVASGVIDTHCMNKDHIEDEFKKFNAGYKAATMREREACAAIAKQAELPTKVTNEGINCYNQACANIEQAMRSRGGV